MASNLTVIIPTRNEVLSIGRMIDEVRSLDLDLDILVVDYKSVDGTREVVLHKGVKLLDESSKGKAVAVRIGLREAKSPYIIVINGDLTYPAKFVGLLYYILSKGSDGVMGPRLFKGKDSMSILHSIGNFGLSLLASILYGYRVFDVNTGLWGYRKEVIDTFDLSGEDFCLEADVFSNAIMRGYKITQVPIEYRARIDGSRPKLDFWDGFRIAWFLIKRRLGKL